MAAGACGSYFYADLAIRLRQAGLLRLPRGRAPHGLDALYRYFFDEHIEPSPRAHTVLCLLGSSKGHGFTARQVAALLKASRHEVERVVATLSAVLAGSRQVRPNHRCVTEYLLASLPPDIDPAEFDWQISQPNAATLGGPVAPLRRAVRSALYAGRAVHHGDARTG